MSSLKAYWARFDPHVRELYYLSLLSELTPKPEHILCGRIRRVCIIPTLVMSVTFLTAGPHSEHYIGYIPLEIYQNAPPIRGVAGRVLVEQHA
jgi:hypothetical protein